MRPGAAAFSKALRFCRWFGIRLFGHSSIWKRLSCHWLVESRIPKVSYGRVPWLIYDRKALWGPGLYLYFLRGYGFWPSESVYQKYHIRNWKWRWIAYILHSLHVSKFNKPKRYGSMKHRSASKVLQDESHFDMSYGMENNKSNLRRARAHKFGSWQCEWERCRDRWRKVVVA